MDNIFTLMDYIVTATGIFSIALIVIQFIYFKFNKGIVEGDLRYNPESSTDTIERDFNKVFFWTENENFQCDEHVERTLFTPISNSFSRVQLELVEWDGDFKKKEVISKLKVLKPGEAILIYATYSKLPCYRLTWLCRGNRCEFLFQEDGKVGNGNVRYFESSRSLRGFLIDKIGLRI